MTHDPVNHPSHYTSHPSGVECITIIRHMNFNLGNALKYIWRAGQKGDAVEDLRKAVFYLNDEIARIEDRGTAVADVPAPIDRTPQPYWSNIHGPAAADNTAVRDLLSTGYFRVPGTPDSA